MSNVIKEELIKQLATGAFLSGQLLGDKFGVSRAGVAKHIKTLTEMGLEIYRVSGKGYKLSQHINLLNKQEIVKELNKNSIDNLVEVHSLIDSTNSYFMRMLSQNLEQGQVCVAEYQSSGRGRRGKKWVSPFGSNIYLSMHWYLEQGMSAAMGLSVVAALAVSDAIKSLFNIQVQLKWPNDIYLDGVKLAGILIDLEGQALEPCHCVIGIGLNLAMTAKSAEQVDQPWTDLQSHLEDSIDRNKLTAEIITHLMKRLLVHKEEGITSMVAEWKSQDYYLYKPVKLITGNRETLGICKGINDQGALLLEVEVEIKSIYGGEVSLRPGK